MRILKSVALTTTPSAVVKSPLRLLTGRPRLVVAISLIILVVLFLVLRQSDPLTELSAAQALWAAQGISDYRILVEYQRPFNTCQQDFKVQGDVIGYKYADSCTLGVAAVAGNEDTLPTVARLFAQVENSVKNPECGTNGCACDGPIEMRVSYDPQRGYPQQITYELRPDLRWRYLEYWIAQINGSLAACPPTAYVGQTITVLSLETAPKPTSEAGKPDKAGETDKAPGSIGEAFKPEATAEATP